jgi:hypothetical protein
VSPFITEPVFQDDLVNNIAAEDASPAEELIANAVKLLENHRTPALMTFHGSLLSF